MRNQFFRIDTRQWSVLITVISSVLSVISLWFSTYEENSSVIIDDLQEMQSVLNQISNTLNLIETSNDANFQALENIVGKGFTETITNITKYGERSLSYYDFQTTQAFANYSQELHIANENLRNQLEKQANIEEIQGEIKGSATSIKDNVIVIKDVQKEIKDFLISPEFGKFVLEKLNEFVTTFSADTLTSIDVNLDVCEYDPLGIGPIVCEGSEILKARLTGIKFE